MSDCKENYTPLFPNEHLGPATGEEIESSKILKVNFRSAVGSINYISSATRPNLAHAVSSLLQYLENPVIQHWKHFLHILQHLKGSQELVCSILEMARKALLHIVMLTGETVKQPEDQYPVVWPHLKEG
ncbi:hypothetical protein O181_048759 [Austropuccinia psidii MF-1]|uniref:Uncharacterized protein n=1 Tax=Austropuccinia psidii MF-1 TaxID=1389203 RepID=A0A9Q3DTH2_9BASI|nr:hypothetical protein [Austropuccinia psidii MF-1]